MNQGKATAPTPDDWKDSELKAAVLVYREIQAEESKGRRVVKVDYYRKLADSEGRSVKAWEFRMQNISSVLASLGQDWIQGLKPRGHVGVKVETKLKSLLRAYELRQ